MGEVSNCQCGATAKRLVDLRISSTSLGGSLLELYPFPPVSCRFVPICLIILLLNVNLKLIVVVSPAEIAMVN